MIEILSYVFWVLLALTLLVFVHEMGHFLAAKFFGMRVDRFSIGFPPIIAGKQWGETEYVIGATPLGGYVKIAGMIDESMDTDHVGQEPEPHEFRAKPVWQRVIVITAGVIFNMILAAVIFVGLKMSYGDTYVPAENVEAVQVADESLAYEMGLRTGDRVTAVNGRRPERMSQILLGNPDDLLADSLTITVERGRDESIGGREGSGGGVVQHTFTAPPDIMTQLTHSVREGEGLGIQPIIPAVVSGVQEGMPAAEAGLRAGDRIVGINGEPVRYWNDLSEKVEGAGGRPLSIRWTRPADSARTGQAVSAGGGGGPQGARAGGVFERRLTPRYDSTRAQYLIGVASPTRAMMQEALGTRRVTYGPGEAVSAGLQETWTTSANIVESFQRIFFGRDSFRANVGGPVEIARVTKQAADSGADRFWFIVAFLSITLAIMNILPIPALDGGHLMFLLYEGVTRRRPSEKVRMVMQQVGFVVLIGFMVFVVFNDLLRLGS